MRESMTPSELTNAGRRRGRRCAGLTPLSSSSNTSRARTTAGRKNMSWNSSQLLLCSAMAAVVFPSFFFAEARDTSTVSAGYQHSCVVTGDATVKCFGYGKNGELGLGDDANRGDDAGSMGDMLPDVDLGAGVSATAVSASWQHTCALLEGVGVKCWGRNDYGQLGQGDFVDRGDDPSTMGGNLSTVDLGSAPSGNGTAVATAISTGQQFTCVLVDGGSVKCFGKNDEGQCGRGNLDTSVGSKGEDMGDNLPYVDLGTGVQAVSISSGSSTTCAALLGGGIKCWGGNSYGGVGVGDSYNVGDELEDMGDNLKEVELGTGEVGSSVVCGLRHVCAILVGGNVKCWGDNRSGQLGLGHIDTRGDDANEMGDELPFVDLGAGRTATSLSLGESHSCAVLDDNSVRCWGKGFKGQLGRGEYLAKGKFPGEMGAGLTAVDLGTNVTVSTLAAGSDHTCATLGDGSLKCWGRNTLGALGLEDTLDRGDGQDEMGDALPAVSLGTGVTVAADAGATLPPTPAPTAAPTPAPTVQPTPSQATPAPSQAAADALTPEPTPGPTPQQPTTEPTTVRITPAPTQAEESRGVDTLDTAGDADDGGSFTSSNIAVAAYVAAPLLGFALLLCFCARRRRSDRDRSASARTGSWTKGGGSSGVGGHLGGTAAVAGVDGASGSTGGNHVRSSSLNILSGGSGSVKIIPASSSMSTPNTGQQQDNLSGVNLAEHLAVGGVGGEGGGSRHNKHGGGGGGKNPKSFPRCGSDTAFSMTSCDDIGEGVVIGGGGSRGGGGSDSSRGAGTGRSASPPGYEEDTFDDDAAASVFYTEGRASAEGRAENDEVDDDLSENGWGSFKRTGRAGTGGGGDGGGGGLPSYADTQRRGEEQHQWRNDGLVTRASSNRERNSDRMLTRHAARTGRQAIPRRSDEVVEAALAAEEEARRSVSMR